MATVDAKKAFLGTGWAFPLCVGSDGGNAMAMYEEDIKQSIRIILGTDQGERVMRPDFGAGLRSFIFGPISATSLQRIKTRVQDALTKWEPRIDVLPVKITFDSSDGTALLIDITYRVRITNTLQNLVYPFYLQEGSPQ